MVIILVTTGPVITNDNNNNDNVRNNPLNSNLNATKTNNLHRQMVDDI